MAHDWEAEFNAAIAARETKEPASRKARALVASQVSRKRVEWLEVEDMHGRISIRDVTVIAGDPGLGKSMKAQAIAGAVSRNGGTALIATAEDSLEATARPRLEAVGADLDRIAFIQMFWDGYPDGLRIPDDVAELERLVVELDARVVVIDPLMAHLPGEINSWRDQSIRLALAPLHALAERQGCAVIVIAHLNKSSSSDWLRRVGGSIAVSGAARSVLLLARDPDDPEGEKGSRRVLAHVKCNVGPLMPSLLYEVQPIVIPASEEDPEVETAKLVSLGTSGHDAEQLLAGRGDPEERSALDEAVAFLTEELGEDRVMDAKVVQKAARDAGISDRTLKRARGAVGVVSERIGGIGPEGHWTWRLRGPSSSAPLGDQELGTLSANPHGKRDPASSHLVRGPKEICGLLSDDDPEDDPEVARDRALHNARLGDEMYPVLLADAARDEHITPAEFEARMELQRRTNPA
jgi:hypothetical protein